MAGMRDKLIHEYFGISYEIVWETIMEDIPFLKRKIEEILNEIIKKKFKTQFALYEVLRKCKKSPGNRVKGIKYLENLIIFYFLIF